MAPLHTGCRLGAALSALLACSCSGDFVALGDAPHRTPTACAGVAPSAQQRELLVEVGGFGRATTGGAEGCLWPVTQLGDAGPGSLREALSADGPAWIVFDVAGELELESPLEVASHKTLDARGHEVTLRGHGLQVVGPVENVIITGLRFEGGKEQAQEGNDAITLRDGARRVWIHHCDFSGYGDGLVDLSHGATDVTISWSRFHDHDKVMLFGADVEDAEDAALRVTLHHNFFDNTGTYHPRLRRGKVHSYNNLFRGWRDFASNSSLDAELVSEANVYEAGDSKQATVTRAGDDPAPGRLRSVGDLPLNDAEIVEREPQLVFDPRSDYAAKVAEANAELVRVIEAQAGLP